MQGSRPGPGCRPPRRKCLKSRPPAQAPIGCRSLPGPIAGEGGDVTARGGRPQGGAHLGTRRPGRGLSGPSSVEPARGCALCRCSLGCEVGQPPVGADPRQRWAGRSRPLQARTKLGLESELQGWRRATAATRAPAAPLSPGRRQLTTHTRGADAQPEAVVLGGRVGEFGLPLARGLSLISASQ